MERLCPRKRHRFGATAQRGSGTERSTLPRSRRLAQPAFAADLANPGATDRLRPAAGAEWFNVCPTQPSARWIARIIAVGAVSLVEQ